MKLKLTSIVLGAVMAAGPALADLVLPMLSYRTGAYAVNGIPFADGYNDYLTLMNERDGGIGGVKIESKVGSMKFDNTIDAKIDRLKPLIRKEIASKFGVNE